MAILGDVGKFLVNPIGTGAKAAQSFFTAPGTGATKNAMNKASEISDAYLSTYKENMPGVLDAYKSLLANRQNAYNAPTNPYFNTLRTNLTGGIQAQGIQGEQAIRANAARAGLGNSSITGAQLGNLRLGLAGQQAMGSLGISEQEQLRKQQELANLMAALQAYGAMVNPMAGQAQNGYNNVAQMGQQMGQNAAQNWAALAQMAGLVAPIA